MRKDGKDEMKGANEEAGKEIDEREEMEKERERNNGLVTLFL